jgi:hypothetical protein
MKPWTVRKTELACLAFAAAAVASPAIAANSDPKLCASISSIPALIGPGYRCRETRYGVVVGPSDGEVTSALTSIDNAAAQFLRHFGAPPLPVAVIFGGTLDRSTRDSIVAKGFTAMPWVSPSDQAALVKATIRKQVLQQTAGMAAAQQEAIIARALAQQAARQQTAMNDVPREGALSHEIAHAWFRRFYDGNAVALATGVKRYGSTAPDWLDEMAAVLAEDDIITEKRRAGIALAFSPEGTSRFWPLETYFTMEHPLHAAASAAARATASADQGNGGTSARILTGDEAKALLAAQGSLPRADWFYVQARLFGDYLMTTSNNPRIFSDIAEGLKGGASTSGWLAANGARNRLPTDIAKLQAGWDAWLRAKAAKGGASPPGKPIVR